MKLNFIRFAAPMLALLAAACASDPNPIDLPAPSHQMDEQASINLSFNVADSKETRAGEELLSTDAEKKISKVAIYVFNDDDNLEKEFKDLTFDGDKLSASVTFNPGVKTFYAIAYKNDLGFNSPSSISDLLSKEFSSTLDQIASADGFVMVGNTSRLNMVKGGNDVSIDMIRVAAKAQVMKAEDLTLGNSVGNITFSNLECKVMQQSLNMSVGGNVDFGASATSSTGTYSHLSAALKGQEGYVSGVLSSFTADGCMYMPENPFGSTVSGKATFLSIRMKVTANEAYNGSGMKTAFNPIDSNGTFYAIGNTNMNTAVTAYILDGDKKVMVFNTESEANNYLNSLDTYKANGYKVIAFTNGLVYYRANIKHDDSYKVERNTFYKVTVSEILALGSNTEVIPEDPETPLDVTESTLGVTFSVADWNEKGMDVKLD